MKKNIYLLYIIVFLQGMVFYAPIATLYRQAQGVPIFQITIIESISLILCLILEIPWGIIADKIGYKRTMIFCSVLYFISKIIFWQATGFWWFLLERILLSIVIAGMSGVDESILFLSCEKGKSHKVFGIYNSLQMAGLLIAVLVFSFFIKDDYSKAALFTVISYGIAAICSFFLEEVKKEAVQDFGFSQMKHILKNTLTNPKILIFLVAVALLSETNQTITVFLNQLQYVRCGFSTSNMGYVYILITCIGLFSGASVLLVRKLGGKIFGILLYGLAACACITLAFTSNIWISVGSIFALRLSFQLFQPFQMDYQNKHIVSSSRATALSVNAMIIDCIGVGTNLVFGYFADINLMFSFLFGGMICVIALGLFVRSLSNFKK